MRRLKLAARAGAAVLAFLAYVWFAAVGNADEVRERKAARRRERRLRPARTRRP